MKENKGFTLIELLVVIAIIGILSAVVLASLNTARSKGSDTNVKANLDTVATQAALYFADNGGYGTFAIGACPTSGSGTVFHNDTIQKAITAALTASSGGTTACVSSGTAYAVAVSRPAEVAANTSAYWCVDSTGEHCGVNLNTLEEGECGACITRQ